MSLLLYLCYIFRALINSLVCWFCRSVLGLVVFRFFTVVKIFKARDHFCLLIKCIIRYSSFFLNEVPVWVYLITLTDPKMGNGKKQNWSLRVHHPHRAAKLILVIELGARVSVSFLALAHKNKKQKNIRILLLGYTVLKIYAASNGCLFKPLVSPWIRRHTMTSFLNYVDVPDKIWFILWLSWDSSVVRTLNSWSKGRGFESR